MSTNVRIYGCRGSMQLPVSNPFQLQADTIQSLTFPYEWGQLLLAGPDAPINSTPMPLPRTVEVLHVEVQDGSSIRFEVNATQFGVVTLPASQNSPRLSGSGNFRFGPSWIFSVIEDQDAPFFIPGEVSDQTLVETTPYAVRDRDFFLLVNVTASAAVVTLPSGNVRAGLPLTIKDVSGNAGVNNITINASGLDPYGIDGNTSFVIDVNYGAYLLIPRTVGPAGWMVTSAQ